MSGRTFEPEPQRAPAPVRAGGEDLTVEIAGEQLVLLPERAVHWPRREMLLVADSHFGKAAAFRAAGIPVPRGGTAEALGRLDAALARTAARRIVLLGDFLHAKEGRAPDTLRTLALWRATHADRDVWLVRGNHDRHAGDPPPELGISCADQPLFDPPFVLAHHPRPSDVGYVLAGHLHPGVRLAGPGRQHARLACFWFGARVGVLPAFGDFTGLADVTPATTDRVFVVSENHVVTVTQPPEDPA